MTRINRLGLTVLAGLGFLLAGCQKNASGPGDTAPVGVTNEISAMNVAAQTDAFVTNAEATFADASIAPTNYDQGFAKVDSAITPLRWGRFITSITRVATTTVLPGDTLSLTTVDRTIVGVLKIKTVVGGIDSLIQKPFQDKSTRRVIFKRVGNNPNKYWQNWEPVATTIVVGGTNPAPANYGIQITKLVVTADTMSVTVTNPDSVWLRYEWKRFFHGGRGHVPELNPMSPVTISATVLSQSADTDLVALRHGFGFRSMHFSRKRMNLVSQSGPDANGYYARVYSLTVSTHVVPGDFHFGIDAVTRATLYDTVAPYSVSWWGFPYRVN